MRSALRVVRLHGLEGSGKRNEEFREECRLRVVRLHGLEGPGGNVQPIRARNSRPEFPGAPAWTTANSKSCPHPPTPSYPTIDLDAATLLPAQRLDLDAASLLLPDLPNGRPVVVAVAQVIRCLLRAALPPDAGIREKSGLDLSGGREMELLGGGIVGIRFVARKEIVPGIG